jgi:hypothetical protein
MSAETVSLFCGNFPTFVDVGGNGFVFCGSFPTFVDVGGNGFVSLRNFPTFVDVGGNGFVILRELISVGIVRVHTEVVHLLIGPSVQALKNANL